MPKFEAHITCLRSEGEMVQKFCELTGWTYSQIDGDPIMGKRAYCYATAYREDGHVLLAETSALARNLEQAGVTVLREKVEQIMYDTKTGVNEL